MNWNIAASSLPPVTAPPVRPGLWRGRFLLAGLCLAMLAPLASGPAQACTVPLEALPDARKAAGDAFFSAAATKEFYGKWGDSCAWSDQAAQALLARIADAGDDGIDPRFLNAGDLSGLAATDNSTAARARDLMLTNLALRYARVMSLGQVDLTEIERSISFPRRKPDLAGGLAAALAQGNIARWLQGLAPQDPAYGQLKQMLAYYRLIEKNGGWKALPSGRGLKPGEDSPLLPELRQRLMTEGDLTSPADGSLFDAATVEALKRFQTRHGLTADGVLGSKTRRMLNVPVDTWIARIVATLDRWRSLGPSLPPTRFEVNVAAGQARLLVDENPVLSMRAIVGKPQTPTPMLLSTINEVIINPTWTIPWSIINNEISVALRHNPYYLAQNDMHWVNGWLVQEPGPENPLGRLKFNFVNPFSVYLHDTPFIQRFAEDNRALSHGCVRLEQPLELATWLLKENPAWSRLDIQDATTGLDTIRIPVAQTLPVAIVYWTAFVDADGLFELRDDIYGRDERLTEALAEGRNLTARP